MGVPTDEGSSMPKPTQSDLQGNVPGSASDPVLRGPDDDFMEENVEDENAMEVEHVARVVEQNFIGNIDHAMGNLGSMEPNVDDAIAELLVAQMGSTGRQRLREQRSGFWASPRRTFSTISRIPRAQTSGRGSTSS